MKKSAFLFIPFTLSFGLTQKKQKVKTVSAIWPWNGLFGKINKLIRLLGEFNPINVSWGKRVGNLNDLEKAGRPFKKAGVRRCEWKVFQTKS